MSAALALARLPGRPTTVPPAPSLSGPAWRLVARARSHGTLAALAGAGSDACPWPADDPRGHVRLLARLWTTAHTAATTDLRTAGMAD